MPRASTNDALTVTQFVRVPRWAVWRLPEEEIRHYWRTPTPLGAQF